MKTLSVDHSAGFEYLLIVVLGVAFLAWLLFDWISRRKGRSSRRWMSKPRLRLVSTQPPSPTQRRPYFDPLTQQEAISKVDFETWPLLNKSEARLLPALEALAREAGNGIRLMAQTSLGEIIRPSESSGSQQERDEAYAAVNAKRLDFAFFDRSGRIVLAVEYQGRGHYGSTGFMRDAVKREALRKAGVPFLEIPAEPNFDVLRHQVMEVISSQVRRP